MDYQKLDKERKEVECYVKDLHSDTRYMGENLYQVYNTFQYEYKRQIDRAKQLQKMQERENLERSIEADTNKMEKLQQKLTMLSKKQQENEKAISDIKAQIEKLGKSIEARQEKLKTVEEELKTTEPLNGKALSDEIKKQSKELKNYNKMFKYFKKQILRQHGNYRALHHLIEVLNELGVEIYYNEKGNNYKIGNQKRLEDLIEENHLPEETLATIKVALGSFQQYDIGCSYDGNLTKDVIDSNKMYLMPDKLKIQSLTVKFRSKIKNDSEYWIRLIREEHKYKYGGKEEPGKIKLFFKKMYIRITGQISSIVKKPYFAISKRMKKQDFDDETVIGLVVSELLEEDKLDQQFSPEILDEIARLYNNGAEIREALTNFVREWYMGNKDRIKIYNEEDQGKLQVYVDKIVGFLMSNDLRTIKLETLLEKYKNKPNNDSKEMMIPGLKPGMQFKGGLRAIPVGLLNERPEIENVNCNDPYQVIPICRSLLISEKEAISFYKNRHPGITYEPREIDEKAMRYFHLQGKEEFYKMAGEIEILQIRIDEDIAYVIQFNQELSPEWKKYIEEQDVFTNANKKQNIPQLYIEKAKKQGVEPEDFQEYIKTQDIYSRIQQIIKLPPVQNDEDKNHSKGPDETWIEYRRREIDSDIKLAPPGMSLEDWRKKVLNFKIAEEVERLER